MIKQFVIYLPEMSKGSHLITTYIESELGTLPEKGLLHIFLQHTSAGLTINENADPSVRYDFNQAMDHLAPEDMIYKHNMEGPDDMPAHIKSSLVGQSLTIPIINSRLALGTWQGIYLCEFRNYGGTRKIILTIYS